MSPISKETYKELLEKMLLTRRFEEKVSDFFAAGSIHGTTHLYIGEEAVATGVCTAIAKEDMILSTHRGHGHCISKGIDLGKMMAELLGKATGCCKGKGGSMHIADIETGNLGENGIVGGGLPLSVGVGLSTRMQGLDRIVVCFFGDGTTNQGAFHEALNLASVWKLPLLFVCEDNKYGMSNSKKDSMNIEDISVRASSYGIKGVLVDGMDVLKVYEETLKAKEYVKEHGPMLLVCDTYRYVGHSKSDANVYRTEEEIEYWRRKDPIDRLGKYLEETDIFTRAELDQIQTDTRQAIEDATAYAEASAYPSIDDIANDVYA